MLEVQCPTEFAEVMKFAAENGLVDQLIDKLVYLSNYANGEGCAYDKNDGKDTKCVLYTDFAPHSFSFVIYKKESEEATPEIWFQGGVIYQGPDSLANGNAPSFCVSVAKGIGWFVHT